MADNKNNYDNNDEIIAHMSRAYSYFYKGDEIAIKPVFILKQFETEEILTRNNQFKTTLVYNNSSDFKTLVVGIYIFLLVKSTT